MPQNVTAFQPFQCCGIVCNEKGLFEMSGARALVKASRETIQRITVGRGVQAQHPILQVWIGLALIMAGYFPVVHIFRWLHGGTLLTVELWMIPLVALGIWLVLSAFKCGYFVDVQLPRERKRLVFNAKPGLDALNRFISSIEQCYGIRIDREDLPARPISHGAPGQPRR